MLRKPRKRDKQDFKIKLCDQFLSCPIFDHRELLRDTELSENVTCFLPVLTASFLLVEELCARTLPFPLDRPVDERPLDFFPSDDDDTG